jgi:hypothetical protein
MLLTAVLLYAVSAVWSQTATTGVLRGTVADPSGEVIANADIQVTNEGTGEHRQVKSSTDGIYAVPLLPPGTYTVEAGAQGFAREVHRGVVIAVTEATVLNMRLKIGATSETVEVKGAAPIVDTTTNTLGEVVSPSQVQSLPLVNRNFTQIMDLSSGVVASVTDAAEIGRGSGGVTSATAEGQGMNVQGARASDNNFQMNGVTINDFLGSELGIAIPNPDTIEEFKVQTGMYDAEYGRNAGANVDVVTKTGTNSFHGSLFEFWRNDVLNANDFFVKENGLPRPELKQNQFGGTFGGPIVKNKLLFFGSYQGTRQVNAVQGRQTFVSPPLTDDRSAAGIGAIFAGQQGLQYIFGPPGFGPAVAADGSNINSVALNLLQLKLPNGNYLFPTPNPANCSDGNCEVSVTVPAVFHENQYMSNFEYLQSAKNTIQGRFFTASSNVNNSFPIGNGGNLAGSPLVTDQTYVVASVSDNYVISPTLFNQLRFGYARTHVSNVPHPPFTYSQIGVTSSAQNNALPDVSIAGSDALGGNAYAPNIQNNFDLEDGFSWVHGRHNFRFGGGLIRSQQFNPGQTYYGPVVFASWPDFLLGMSGAENGTAGLPNFPPNGFSNVEYSFDLLGILQAATRTWEASAYFQDDFRFSSRLTLNIGLRYEWMPPFTALRGRATNINPSLVDPNPPDSGSYAGYIVPSNYTESYPMGVTKSSINSFVPGSGNNTWGPRIGFAYSVLPNSDRVVLRSGYGIYYSAITGNSEIQSIPSLPWADLRVFAPPYNGSATFSDPFVEPIPSLSAFPFFEPYSPSTDISFISTQQSVRPGITQEYTLNLQTQLSPTLALQVAYVGSKADHLIYSRSINQAGLATASNPIRGLTTSTQANLSERVPYLGFDPANFLEQASEGRSNYNALEVTLKKNVSKGLQFLASYTFSKTLATGSATIVGSSSGGGTVGNQNNLYAGYGPANFSRPQRLIVSASYELPKVNYGPKYAKTLLNGWTLLGVMTLQSGTPLTFLNTNSTNLYGITGTNGDFAYYDPTNVNPTTGEECNAHIRKSGSVRDRLNEYFNTSCFTTPPVISSDGGTDFGNTGAGILRGPDQRNFDLSLSKMTPLGLREGVNLEFRAEFFNAFNTPQFANPDTSYADVGTSFGKITGTSVAPRIGQLALKLHF